MLLLCRVSGLIHYMSQDRIQYCVERAEVDRKDVPYVENYNNSYVISILSDIHFDHEDKLAWALTKRLLKDLPVDRVVLGGDIIDLGPLSIFKAAPQEKLALGDQIRHSRKELGALRKAVGDIPIDFFNGNHEERLQFHIWGRTPELDALQEEELNILTINNLFHLDHWDIRHVRATPMKVMKMYLFHGHEIPTRAT